MQAVSTPTTNVHGPIADPDPLLNPWDRFAYHVFKALLRVFSPHIWMMAWDQLSLSRRLYAKRLQLKEKIAFQEMVGDTLLAIEEREKKYQAKLQKGESHQLFSEGTKVSYANLAQEIRQVYVHAQN